MSPARVPLEYESPIHPLQTESACAPKRNTLVSSGIQIVKSGSAPLERYRKAEFSFGTVEKFSVSAFKRRVVGVKTRQIGGERARVSLDPRNISYERPRRNRHLGDGARSCSTGTPR